MISWLSIKGNLPSSSLIANFFSIIYKKKKFIPLHADGTYSNQCSKIKWNVLQSWNFSHIYTRISERLPASPMCLAGSAVDPDGEIMFKRCQRTQPLPIFNYLILFVYIYKYCVRMCVGIIEFGRCIYEDCCVVVGWRCLWLCEGCVDYNLVVDWTCSGITFG